MESAIAAGRLSKMIVIHKTGVGATRDPRESATANR